MKNLLQIAINEFGVKEIIGPKHNDRIIKYAHDSKFTWINDDETPWCSTFMNWVALEAGLQNSKSAAARSWLNVGFETQNPEPGDVVVFWREHINSKLGHVGIYLGYSKDQSRIYVLGGNQDNAVSISAYPANRLLSFRRLTNSNSVSLPTPPLQNGSRGPQVIAIQNALKILGYNPGTSDGIFGDKTQQALEQLQTTDQHVKITGIYNTETKNLMEGLLANKD
ncbi:TIGR02594 family protein [Bizionia sediminis]|uniref:TIGR02594 family protein n=1 Tax=Bizionia sediminis TaxID=1737064 RepID=A0ABW5KT63_9FLAO